MNLWDLLFPKYCLECKKEGKYICDTCYNKVTPYCHSKVQPYGRMGDNYSVFKYEGVIRKAIISLKYKFATDIVEELVSRLVPSLISQKYFSEKTFTLIPIPLFWQRENFRGFNQSDILGKKLAEKMNWKFIPDLLIRNKNTVPQVGLKGLSRRQNLSGVFIVNPNYSFLTLNSSLILFDDVYTTGSTIKEAKKVLEKAGFKNVKSLTIAR